MNWVQSANQFHCLCPGSVYTIDGLNVSGPAPLLLGVFRWKLAGGDVYIELESTFTHAHQWTGESPHQLACASDKGSPVGLHWLGVLNLVYVPPALIP